MRWPRGSAGRRAGAALAAGWSRRRQRGVALLMVLSMLAVVGSVAAEFQFESHVDLQLAYGARDELQAEYNALSALRMRALILKQSRKIQQAMMALAAASGAAGSPPPLGPILEMLPVECGLMNAITHAVDARDRDSHAGEKEDFFPGDCLATSESEHAKISINLLRNSSNQQAVQVAQSLMAVLGLPQMRKYFEQDDRNGVRADSAAELVGNIADYIDQDRTTQGNLGDEDRRYQSLKRPYRAKNGAFDSVAELQMVYGVNDALFELLRDQVSIHTSSVGIELQTAPVDRIMFQLLGALNQGGDPTPFLTAMPLLYSEISALKGLGGMMTPMTRQVLTALLTTAGVLPLFDNARLQQAFTDSTSTTWYTLFAEGRVGNASRRIRAVYQATEGLFYYVRME